MPPEPLAWDRCRGEKLTEGLNFDFAEKNLTKRFGHFLDYRSPRGHNGIIGINFLPNEFSRVVAEDPDYASAGKVYISFANEFLAISPQWILMDDVEVEAIPEGSIRQGRRWRRKRCIGRSMPENVVDTQLGEQFVS